MATENLYVDMNIAQSMWFAWYIMSAYNGPKKGQLGDYILNWRYMYNNLLEPVSGCMISLLALGPKSLLKYWVSYLH